MFERPPPEHRWSAKAEGTGNVSWIATDFDARARVAFDTEGPLPAEDEARIDAARARVLAFAKDQALLDWLDEPELERAWESAERVLEKAGENPTEVLERAGQNIVLATGGALAPELEPVAFDARSVIDHFLTNLAPDTKLAYRSDLEQFAEWCGSSTEAAVAVLLAQGAGPANAAALRWLGAMRDAGLSTATRRRRLAALKSVVRAARMLGAVQWSIEVRGPRVETFKDTRGPGEADTNRIIETCSNDLTGLRDCAMLLLAAGRGLRRREIAAAKRSSLDVAGKRMFVEGKGEKNEWVTLPEETLAAIERWTTAWDAAHGAPEDGFLFRSLSNKTLGRPITRKGVYHAVVAAGKRAGVVLWTHALRHTGITMVLDETDGDIRAAQQFARHSDPRVTMKYDDNRVDTAGDVAERITKKISKKGEGDG